MKKMDIVITMGGLGSRFQKAGYTVPKYMIKVKGKTLFAWSMISLGGFRDITEQYIFVAREEEDIQIKEFIKKECEDLGIQNYKIVSINYLTDGQATTAMLAKEYWNYENALLVYNIDTYVEAGEMNSEQLKGDGFIPCFYAEGEHWSFVKTDGTGKVIEVREKKRISDHCTIGAYYFKSCKLYQKLYEEYYKEELNLEKGEKYIAPLYNYLLEQKGEVYFTDIKEEKVHVLGTPEELEEFLKNDRKE